MDKAQKQMMVTLILTRNCIMLALMDIAPRVTRITYGDSPSFAGLLD